ncbi:MAG: hypothetical protein FJW39_30765 [Acidobacteria bacterium]|nr:hypothetical protein [Acidobacteriota bacterium]
MGLTRRNWIRLAAQAAADSVERRAARIIREYEEQGDHRTATGVDQVTGEWLAAEVRKCGLTPEFERFSISRVDPVTAVLRAGGRSIEGVPLFDGGFTGAEGVTGRIGVLGGDSPVGLGDVIPNRAEAGPLGEVRRQGRHRAIVLVTRGGRPGLCPSNAPKFLHPYGPPVLQVSSEEAGFLADLAKRGAEVTLIAEVNRVRAEAFNVVAQVEGTDRGLPPLVVMTPRSGWWSCASERGGGIVCWLEVIRAMHGSRPARGVLFVASTGHEIGHAGIETFSEHRPGLIRRARAWIHLGANIGAAQGQGSFVQASDDEMESLLADGLAAEGVAIAKRVPRGTVPGGESGMVHGGGGRYVSLVGTNALFHNRADRGPEAVDVKVIARCAAALTRAAKRLAGG